MSDKEKRIVLKVVDKIAILLTNYGHVWSNEERQLYEKAVSILKK